MKGHIFYLLEKFIIENTSDDVYEEILQSCNFITEEPFVRPGTYPDEDLHELVDKTVQKMGITKEEAHFAFGKWIFPHLIKIAPAEVMDFKGPKELLLSIDYIHMIELKKVMPDATPPRFYCLDTGPDTLELIYSSPREMFDLVDGVLASLEDFYSTKINYRKVIEKADTHRTCKYLLTFEKIN